MTVDPGRFPLILAFDGYCPTCHWFVKMVIRFDSKHQIGFTPLHSSFSQSVLSANPEFQSVDSVLAIRIRNYAHYSVAVKSQAVIEVIRQLGGWWRVFLLVRIVPIPILDRMYDWVAKNRYRWFGRYESCEIPDSSIRERLIG